MGHVLVTGAGGFSGSHLVSVLLERNHDVSAVVRRSPGRLPVELKNHRHLNVITADLSQPLSLPERVDAIVHAAARSPGPGVSVEDMIVDNVVASAALYAYARRCGARSLIFFSSLSVYGKIRQRQVDESTPILEPDVYGATKLLGESLLRQLANEGKCTTLALRLPGVIGPHSERNWLSGVVKAARAGQEIAIYNADAPYNNAIHVTELCGFIVDLLEQERTGHDVVTLGAGGVTTVRKAVETLLQAFGSTSPIRVMSGSELPSFTISSRRAEERYGYRALDIETMLRRFAADNSTLGHAANRYADDPERCADGGNG